MSLVVLLPLLLLEPVELARNDSEDVRGLLLRLRRLLDLDVLAVPPKVGQDDVDDEILDLVPVEGVALIDAHAARPETDDVHPMGSVVERVDEVLVAIRKLIALFVVPIPTEDDSSIVAIIRQSSRGVVHANFRVRKNLHA